MEEKNKKPKSGLIALIIAIIAIIIIPYILNAGDRDWALTEKQVKSALTENDIIGDKKTKEQKEALKEKEEILKITKQIDPKELEETDVQKRLKGDAIGRNNISLITDNEDNWQHYKNLDFSQMTLIIETSGDFIEDKIDYFDTKDQILSYMIDYSMDKCYIITKHKGKVNVYLLVLGWEDFDIYKLENKTISKIIQEVDKKEKEEEEFKSKMWWYLILGF